MVRKHTIIIFYSANMLKIRSRGFDRTVMLINCIKQIANSFAKIINGHKGKIQDPAKHLRWSFFRETVLASEANLESCHTSKMELFSKIVKN